MINPPPDQIWCVTENKAATAECLDDPAAHVVHIPYVPGPIEESVNADLAGADEKIKAGKRALAALARKLARVIDKRGDDEPASQTAKAVDTLRILMNQIMSGEDANPDEQNQLAHILGSPSAGGSAVSAEIRYPKVTGSDDVGSGSGGDRDGAG